MFRANTVLVLALTRPSGKGHGLAFMWREFNPSPTRSCITEAYGLQIKAVSITADGACIYPYTYKNRPHKTKKNTPHKTKGFDNSAFTYGKS